MFSGKEVSDLLAICVLAPDTPNVVRMVPISGFYLGITPVSNYHAQRPQSMSQASPSSVNGNAHKTAPNRASMPVVARTTAGSPPATIKKPFEATPEEESDEDKKAERVVPRKSIAGAETRHKSNGTMDRNFRFPPASDPPPVPGVSQIPPATSPPSSPPVASGSTVRSVAVAPAPDIEHGTTVKIITPSSVEVPPPPPVEKEHRRVIAEEDTEEDVGDTVEIDLR
jgi:hypothetical protein